MICPSDCAPSKMMFTYTTPVSSKVAKGQEVLTKCVATTIRIEERSNHLMPTTVADYVVVSKPGGELVIGGDLDKDFDFSVPSSAAVGQQAALMLMVNTTNTRDLKADVRINGHNVFTYGPSDTNLARPFHTVLDGGVLRTGSNRLNVVISGNSGRFRATDLVLLFQNNVP